MDTIRKLRAKADSTTFPPEREALLAKVGELMAKYGITEAKAAPPRRRAARAQPMGQDATTMVITIDFGSGRVMFGAWGGNVSFTATTSTGGW